MDESNNLSEHLLRNSTMELTEIDTLRSAVAWPHDLSADELVEVLFGSLKEAARIEQQRVEELNLSDTPAKRNRRAVYLDEQSRLRWEAATHDFLERRGDLAMRLTTTALYSTLAMQHLLELDVADLSLPGHARCADDTFICGVSNQFLLDAPRCRYTVDGEVFHLAMRPADEVADAFAARLTRAVQRVIPPALMERITNTMSQSGLAALERSSLCDVAVSGGRQEVEYFLIRDPANSEAVLLTLQVRKSRFSEFVLSSSGEEMSCDSGSSILKAATVSFAPDGDVDVIDFKEEIDIKQGGSQLPAESLSSPLPESCRRQQYPRHNTCLDRVRIQADFCLQLLCCCRRRGQARHVVLRE